MNTIKANLLVLVAVFSIASCNSHSGEKHAEDHSAHEEHHHHAEAIELNNGEKWLVNDEMKPFIAESESLVNAYVENRTMDHKQLAAQLSEQNSGLIKSCTMKGKSHDELHKWLHPHLELVESLEKAEDADQAGTVAAELKESFGTFRQYFQ